MASPVPPLSAPSLIFGPAPTVIEPWEGVDAAGAAERLSALPGLAWLDSSLADGRHGRWSIVACEPRWRLVAGSSGVRLEQDGAVRPLDGTDGTDGTDGGALAALVRLVEAEPPVGLPDGAPDLPFAGGAIGYLGFEVAREIERLPVTTHDDVGAASLQFGWYDAALAWDHAEERGWLVGRPDAVNRLRGHLAASACRPARPIVAGPLQATIPREDYLAAVARAQRYIGAGDIYQVNLAQRFSATVSGDGFDLYRQLRAASPAPFAAYLDGRGIDGGIQVLSSSPERFLLADGDRLETRPIKGTLPRGMTPDEDAANAARLRASAKDLAEHVMIVDLERNDLGRVAVPGSVCVPEFAALESFRQVHHLTSTVRARRRPEVGLEALLRATFPGGSVSGAPKIRALEIIDELEPVVRGVYTGAIGYVSAHGRLDLSIAIRTIALAEGVARFHVGGAIVHDSRAEAEYTETLDKARGMARALGVTLPDETRADEPAG